MKEKRIRKRTRVLCAAAALWLCLSAPAAALAQQYDAQIAQDWLAQFAGALSALAPANDPAQTADPARAGHYLLAYEFGTVLASRSAAPGAQEILEIDLRTAQVTDCRGVRVGMGLEDALSGMQLSAGGAQLSVLSTQESGYGWSWAYVDAGGVYGVEYITYGGEDAQMTEYTLTYVIDAGTISAIRMKMAPATLAQAQEGLTTAEEIASRQTPADNRLAVCNGEPMFSQADLQAMGRNVLGEPVAELVAALGEPAQVQALPGATGRMLAYDGAAARCGLNEYTGEEIVRAISVSSEQIRGPRGLTVGMTVQEAVALFRCDADVPSSGGALYVEGEAMGEAPYAQAYVLGDGEVVLTYACLTDAGEPAVLEIGFAQGKAAYWSLHDGSDAEGGV